MKRILLVCLIAIVSSTWTSSFAQEVTVDIVNSMNGCGLATDCQNDFVCFDILMTVDQNETLDSYNIWVTYDTNVLSRIVSGADATCVLLDGGDTDAENSISAYRVGAIPNGGFPIVANTATPVHTICFNILDVAAYEGTTISVGGDKFGGAIRTTVTFNDGAGNSVVDDTVPESFLTLNSTNAPCLEEPPVIVQEPITTDEEMPVTFCPTVSDPNTGDSLIVSACSAPFNGSATSNDTCITYTPNPDFNGLDSMCVVVCDQTGLCDSVVVAIAVNPVNDAPIAVDDTETVDEDMPVTIDVIGNDTDVDGNIDPTSVAEVDAPMNGTLTIDPVTGDITYTPDPDFNGTDMFTYVVCDDGTPLPAVCDTAEVVVTINPINDAPVAVDDTETTDEDMPVVIDVIGDDTDVDGNIDPTSVAEVDAPMNGTVTIDPVTGDVTYTPDPDFNGTDMFTYVVCDDGTPLPAECDTAEVVVTINPVNDAPVAVDDTETVDEDMPVIIDVVGNDTDLDGNIDPTSVAEVDAPMNGTLTIDPVTGDITYTPNPDFNGTDMFTYVVCDDGTPLPAVCDTAEVVVTVNPVNDAPVASDDTETVDEDMPVVIDALGNDTDVDGNLDPTSVAEVDAPMNGTVTIDPVTGEITYTPDPDFNGTDMFTYVVCDDGTPLPAACDTAEVVVTVNPVNDPPVAVDDIGFTFEDTPVDILVTSNDTDPLDAGNIDPATVAEVDAPANGTTSVNPITGVITYTPNPNFNGMDMFTYVVCDDGTPLPALCDTAMVTVNIFPANDAPVIVNDTVTTPEDTPIDIAILDNDDDPLDPLANIDPTTVTILSDVTNGTTSIDPFSGVVTYTPNMDYTGPDMFTYLVCDDGNPGPDLCDSADVFITVTPVNDAPSITEAPQSTQEDMPVVFCPIISDPDLGDNLTISTCGLPSNGTIATNVPVGCFTYTPDPNFNGFDSVCVAVCDDGTPVLCDSVIVAIRVFPVNDAPFATNDVDTTDEDIPLMIDVIANDDDTDDPLGNIDPTSVSEVTPPSNGSLTIDPVTGVITYTPDLDFNGTDTFEYAVCDDGNPLPALCDTAAVFLLINPIQDCDSLVLSVFLEGNFNGTGMGTELNEFHLLPGQNPALSANPGAQFLGVAAPVGQPYNVAPYNHMGTEGDLYGDTAVGAIPYPATVTDWVLVSIRANNNLPNDEIWKCAALLHSDGTIEVPEACPCLALLDATDYYVLVEHRNHLVVMSEIVQKTDGNLTFDFTTTQSWMLGIGSPQEAAQKTIGGSFVMYGGNSNQVSGRTDLNSADNSIWINDFGDIFRYQRGDHTLNADANSADRSLWIPNNGFFNLIQF